MYPITRLRQHLLASLLCVFGVAPALADAEVETRKPAADILYPEVDAGDAGHVDWIDALAQIPPLSHELGDRWPLILWRVLRPQDINEQNIRMLLARGLVPALPLNRDSIDNARLMQRVGAPVILTDGKGARSSWPYNLIRDTRQWAYRYRAGAHVPDRWRRAPVPSLFAGWALAAAEIRKVLQSFRDNHIEVDAVWLDYESQPALADYRAAVASENGVRYLPSVALESKPKFDRYIRRLWLNLLSAYVAAPVREVYPRVSVTNWVATLSDPEFPVRNWLNIPHPLLGSTLFTATNPVAYGVDLAFDQMRNTREISNQRDVDLIYISILLRHVSADSHARQYAPELESIVWIARWVPDNVAAKTPVMGRPAYREALRHLWLRGVSGMQIFSPVRKGYSRYAVEEVEDAVVVFDEMLGHSDILRDGEVLNFAHQVERIEPVLWSGIRSGDQALIRVVPLRPGTREISLTPWPDTNVVLPVPTAGATYVVRRGDSPRSITTAPESPTRIR